MIRHVADEDAFDQLLSAHLAHLGYSDTPRVELSVAESADQLGSGRTVSPAIAEIVRNSGTQFDPRVVEAFLAIESRMPRAA